MSFVRLWQIGGINRNQQVRGNRDLQNLIPVLLSVKRLQRQQRKSFLQFQCHYAGGCILARLRQRERLPARKEEENPRHWGNKDIAIIDCAARDRMIALSGHTEP
ncbi:hypothetical protein [Rhizobium lusitanum]|uniref:hypothetical protein n=1 Tax=Rhizobium lusitanum TaxID=293958 RepID=UPI0013DC3D87|nr:hypothetical protein [Rhizobium lusitanum]